ncbi:hypothetical protein ACSBL2_05655 [Pedobacter sp. AW31-3R]|uniref:hypothetical protein n=1 Tax=Pedobacter sp. AW31-3R TaxID=3445781 RepID=UPI003FA0A9F0
MKKGRCGEIPDEGTASHLPFFISKTLTLKPDYKQLNNLREYLPLAGYLCLKVAGFLHLSMQLNLKNTPYGTVKC